MRKLRFRLNNAEQIINSKDSSDIAKGYHKLIRRNILKEIQELQIKTFDRG